MLDNIILLLALEDYEGVSENIDIAKGKYKMPQTFQEGWQQRKRSKRKI